MRPQPNQRGICKLMHCRRCNIVVIRIFVAAGWEEGSENVDTLSLVVSPVRMWWSLVISKELGHVPIRHDILPIIKTGFDEMGKGGYGFRKDLFGGSNSTHNWETLAGAIKLYKRGGAFNVIVFVQQARSCLFLCTLCVVLAARDIISEETLYQHDTAAFIELQETLYLIKTVH